MIDIPLNPFFSHTSETEELPAVATKFIGVGGSISALKLFSKAPKSGLDPDGVGRATPLISVEGATLLVPEPMAGE